MAADGPLNSLTGLLMDICGHRQFKPGFRGRRDEGFAEDMGGEAIERRG